MNCLIRGNENMAGFKEKVQGWVDDVEKAQKIRARIKEGEKKLAERLKFIEFASETVPPEEKEKLAKYIEGFNQGLKLYEELCDEFQQLIGYPVWMIDGKDIDENIPLKQQQKLL